MKKVYYWVGLCMCTAAALFIYQQTKENNSENNHDEQASLQEQTSAHSSTEKEKIRSNSKINKSISSNPLESLLVSTREDGVLPWDKIETTIREMLKANPEETFWLLADLDRKEINQYLIRGYILEHYQVTGNWEESLRLFPVLQENVTLATPLLGELLKERAKQSPDAALDWLSKNSQLIGSENASLQLGEVMGTSNQPEKYAEIINSEDIPLKIRTNLFLGLVLKWQKKDINSVMDFFSKHTFSREYDSAIYEIVGKINNQEAEMAMVWAEAIQNNGLRRSAIVESAQSWNQQNQTGYTAWKNKVALPENIIAELP